MQVMIYKRTHKGDPCKCGVFGVRDCMGSFRSSREYDAVLGIGGYGNKPKSQGIAGKLTWVGVFRKIGEEKYWKTRKKKKLPVFTFKHFKLWDKCGDSLENRNSHLWRYVKHRRSFILDLSNPKICNEIRTEVENILKKCIEQPASKSVSGECNCNGQSNCSKISKNSSKNSERNSCR